MKYRVWYSTESFADYVINNTSLREKLVSKNKMYESDANNAKSFHTLPDHIKQILYLDAPDIIVEVDSEPIFSIEVSTEAGTGHNAFQRFARLAASVENNVPAFYVYPEAVIVKRLGLEPKWDKINPLVFKALDDIMSIYNIPALLYYFPSDYQQYFGDPRRSPNARSKGLIFDSNREYAGSPDSSSQEMKNMFLAMNEVVEVVEKDGAVKGREKLLGKRTIMDRRSFMQSEYLKKGGNLEMSPVSATVKIPTKFLLNYLSCFENDDYKIGELLRSREETIIYRVNASFRGDPYPGALAAIDYLLCREGRTFEERKYNLVLAWGSFFVDDNNQTVVLKSDKCRIEDFIMAVKASESKNLLTKDYDEIDGSEISRYYMQVRYGSTFSKVKHIRVYSYFADAILFTNGSLWRDA